MIHDGVLPGFLFSVATVVPICLGGLLLAVGQSDIGIDRSGVARRLFGKTLQALTWDRVSMIRVFSTSDVKTGEQPQIFHVIPTKIGAVAGGKRRIWFTARPSEIKDVLTAMSYYVEMRRIPVERTVDGVVTKAARL